MLKFTILGNRSWPPSNRRLRVVGLIGAVLAYVLPLHAQPPTSNSADATSTAITPALATVYWHYTVRPGDTVWAIAHAHLIQPRLWRELAAQHRLPAHGDKLLPGQVLKIPVAWLRQQPMAARLMSFSGQVQWQPAGGPAQALQAGVALPDLPMGASVQTGPHSSALLRFADGSTLVIQPQSMLVLDRLSVFAGGSMADTRLRLQSGEVQLRANPGRTAGQTLEVTTPSAVASVRGTRFAVLAQEARSTAMTYEGSVAWQSQGRAVAVAQAQGSVAPVGHPPGLPQDLKPAPFVQAWPTRVMRLPVQLDWEALGGEVGWRWRAFRDEAQTQVIWQQDSPLPNLRWVAPANGVVWLQLNSLQPNGLQSLPALHRLEVDVVRELVVNAMPLQASLFEQSTVQTGLPPLATGQSYLLELARDAAFTDVVWQDAAERAQWSLPKPLAAGMGAPPVTYFLRAWRLSPPQT